MTLDVHWSRFAQIRHALELFVTKDAPTYFLVCGYLADEQSTRSLFLIDGENQLLQFTLCPFGVIQHALPVSHRWFHPKARRHALHQIVPVDRDTELISLVEALPVTSATAVVAVHPPLPFIANRSIYEPTAQSDTSNQTTLPCHLVKIRASVDKKDIIHELLPRSTVQFVTLSPTLTASDTVLALEDVSSQLFVVVRTGGIALHDKTTLFCSSSFAIENVVSCTVLSSKIICLTSKDAQIRWLQIVDGTSFALIGSMALTGGVPHFGPFCSSLPTHRDTQVSMAVAYEDSLIQFSVDADTKRIVSVPLKMPPVPAANGPWSWQRHPARPQSMQRLFAFQDQQKDVVYVSSVRAQMCRVPNDNWLLLPELSTYGFSAMFSDPQRWFGLTKNRVLVSKAVWYHGIRSSIVAPEFSISVVDMTKPDSKESWSCPQELHGLVQYVEMLSDTTAVLFISAGDGSGYHVGFQVPQIGILTLPLSGGIEGCSLQTCGPNGVFPGNYSHFDEACYKQQEQPDEDESVEDKSVDNATGETGNADVSSDTTADLDNQTSAGENDD